MYLLCLSLQLLAVSGAYASGIVGGDEAHRRPYMVSLQKNGAHVCGGMLITRDFVLTSGHCLHRPLVAVLGAHNIHKPEKTQQKIEVKHYYPHKLRWSEKETQYDIMLLKLVNKAKLNRYVDPIKLQVKDYIDAKTRCSVAGWGLNERKENVSRLMEVTVETETSAVCQKRAAGMRWQRYFKAKQMICSLTNKGKGFCQGDSGGPLVCNKKAVGIVAFNDARNCQDANNLDVYMKIVFFIPWINDVMEGHISPTKL